VISYESSVSIDRSPEAVFGYFIDPGKQSLWSGVPMRKLTEGPLRDGSKMEVSFGMGPLKAVIGLEMTTIEENKRMAWTSFSGPIRWDGEYRLAATPAGGTEVSQVGRLTFTGLWRLLEPLVGAEISKGEVKELERLKAVVEGA
jgi:polyketide cyclase/dehydrase/lipid transport protein